MMKTCAWTLALFVTFLFPTGLLRADPKGVIFYLDFPGADESGAYVREYEEIELHHRFVVNFVPHGGSEQERVRRDEYLDSVAYPDLAKGRITNSREYQGLLMAIDSLKKNLVRFPHAKKVIGERIPELERARDLVLQGYVLVDGQWKKIPKVDLDINGTVYREVRLLAFRGGKAYILHGGSVKEWIPRDVLTFENLIALNSTSFDVAIPIPVDYGDEIFRSPEIRSILGPLILSAGASPNNAWGRDIRDGVGKAAKVAVAELNALAAKLPPKDGHHVRALANDLSFPFQRAAIILYGRLDAEAALEQARKELGEVGRVPGDRGIRLGNAQRKVNEAKARVDEYNFVKKPQLARELKVTDERIARHLHHGNREVAQAHAVCLFSFRDYQKLTFPFTPSVSRVWTTMASLSEPSRIRVQEEALVQLAGLIALNWGAEKLKGMGVGRMFGALGADDPFVEFFLGLIQHEIGRQAQDAAVRQIETNVEIIFYEMDTDVVRLRNTVIHILRAGTPGQAAGRAAIELALAREYPSRKDDIEVIDRLLEVMELVGTRL